VQTVQDVLRYLLPGGTGRNEAGPSWETCPTWPPDVFAVAATLVSRSGCYLRRRYNRYDAGSIFSDAYRKRVAAAGDRWSKSTVPPPEVKAVWAKVANAVGRKLGSLPDSVTDATMEMLALADEAAAGIGFQNPGETTAFAEFFQAEHAKSMASALGRGGDQLILRHMPHSCCWLVNPDAVCVQPKTRTAQVGCTLRSLSHNLALLPHRREVLTHWFLGASDRRRRDRELRLLLVPFPYHVPQRSFVPTGHSCPGDAEFFRVDQTWLRTPSGRPIRGADVSRFLLDLVEQCGPSGVDGVVFPELALNQSIVNHLALSLMAQTRVQFLIGGISTSRGGRPRNEFYTALLGRNGVGWTQAKHHRWRIERGQIGMYDLQRLDPNKRWWEDIELSAEHGGREAIFWQFRHGAIIGSLVCEDLARVEPVHSVFRAVGPNLVIALLMDGPQLERRWAGKCSTALTEDPGSSVLTFTSLGLVRRAERHDPASYKVALWRDGSGLARELELERDAHALLLRCEIEQEENWTLDGRSDNRASMRIALRGTSDIRLPQAPDWLAHPRKRRDHGREKPR
jgi:hypothetical protein